MPVLYDQLANGCRVEQLRCGFCVDSSPCSPAESTVSLESLLDTDLPSVTSKFPVTSALKDALDICTAPQQRLRCACWGRKMRQDPAEDGLSNALRIVLEQIALALTRRREQETAVNNLDVADIDCDDNVKNVAGEEEWTISDDGALLTLPNKLTIYSHFATAPEETVFLYNEIFVQDDYGVSSMQLQPGDLIIDAGEQKVFIDCCY